MPVQIQQLSPDVYYVTPPEQPFNQFSSFMAGYLKTRTPWTQRLFQMRVAALDPSARLAALRGLERDKMALEKSYQKALSTYEEDRAEASEPVTYLKGKEDTLLQNRLLDLEREAMKKFNEINAEDPFEDKSGTASVWLAKTLPATIKELANQVDRGGVRLDAAGKAFDEPALSSGSWAGEDSTARGRKEGESWGTGEREAMTRLVDMADRLAEMLKEPSLRDLGLELMPEDQRYRPTANEAALGALAPPQRPRGDDYYEAKRAEINAAYTNPFGKIGGAFPEGSYEPRKGAPPAIEILFGGRDGGRGGRSLAFQRKHAPTTQQDDVVVDPAISDALPQQAWSDFTWPEGLPRLQEEEPVETDAEMYSRLAQESRDRDKAGLLGVDKLPEDPVYQEGFFDELVGGEAQGGYGPSIRQTLEVQPGEETMEPGSEFRTLHEADKISIPWPGLEGLPTSNEDDEVRDPTQSSSDIDWSAEQLDIKSPFSEGRTVQSSVEPYRGPDTAESADLTDWTPWAELPPEALVNSPTDVNYLADQISFQGTELDPRLTASGTATRKGIDNTPNEQQAAALRRLKAAVIDPLEQYGEVTSAFRSKELNEDEEIDGADNSRHLAGLAVDIAPTKGKTLDDLTKAANALKSAGVVENVIVYPARGDKTGHVHIAMKRES